MKREENNKLSDILEQSLFTRIQTVVDVIYALVLFQLFILLPKPTRQMIQQDNFESLIDEGSGFITVVIGIVWIILYWGQSNTQFGHLRKLDKNLASIAIVQLFFLMLYLYFIKLDNETNADVLALVGESVCLAIAGFLGIWFWRSARNKDMLLKEVTSEQASAIHYSFLTEPIVAVITIPFAFINVTWYTLAWLLVIPLGIFFKRRQKAKHE